MLIKCPECGKEISDKAPHCIHCGFPLDSVCQTDKPSNIPKIYRIAILPSQPKDIFNLYKYLVDITGDGLDYLRNSIKGCSPSIISGITYEQALDIKKTLNSYNVNCEICEDESTTNPTHRFDNVNLNQAKDINTIKCPRCGSTAVQVGSKGVSFTAGFLGAGKTVNRCGNCGYKWKP